MNLEHRVWARKKNAETNVERKSFCLAYNSGTASLITLPESRVSRCFRCIVIPSPAKLNNAEKSTVVKGPTNIAKKKTIYS